MEFKFTFSVVLVTLQALSSQVRLGATKLDQADLRTFLSSQNVLLDIST